MFQVPIEDYGISDSKTELTQFNKEKKVLESQLAGLVSVAPEVEAFLQKYQPELANRTNVFEPEIETLYMNMKGGLRCPMPYTLLDALSGQNPLEMKLAQKVAAYRVIEEVLIAIPQKDWESKAARLLPSLKEVVNKELDSQFKCLEFVDKLIVDLGVAKPTVSFRFQLAYKLMDLIEIERTRKPQNLGDEFRLTEVRNTIGALRNNIGEYESWEEVTNLLCVQAKKIVAEMNKAQSDTARYVL